MTRLSSPVRIALVGVAAALLASLARARNDTFVQPVAAAMKKSRSREIVGDLPLRWGASTAAAAPASDVLRADVTVEGSGSATGEDPRRHEKLSDETVCLHAFEDALAKLVSSAREVHAAAIVGIVSAYKGSAVIEDGQTFECHAGIAWSHVFLRAQLVKSLPASRSSALPASGFGAWPPASGFAALEDADAIPLSEKGKERYRHFLTLPAPRAFVVFEDGRWFMTAHDPEAMSKSLDYCARVGKRCWLYAVDDRVVWSADVAKRISSSAQLRAAAPTASEAGE
jgi:hypothetical protein